MVPCFPDYDKLVLVLEVRLLLLTRWILGQEPAADEDRRSLIVSITDKH